MPNIGLKNLSIFLVLILAIVSHVYSLDCYYCQNCTGIELKNLKTYDKAIKRECLPGQDYCIRAEQKINNGNGKEQMKIVAMGCTTVCNAQSYTNTGLKTSCCTENLCNLPKKKGKKGRGSKGKAITNLVFCLNCFECKDCLLRRPVKKECSADQTHCIGIRRKMKISGKIQMKTVTLGCSTDCNEKDFFNTAEAQDCAITAQNEEIDPNVT
ncbi:hypothetical protein BpHYR1_030136 [Brachionus plicatilis]|uniref:Uncharacterized protein n=1 Tax=Brachionus plicatilis TaxID=10195 RepID=A0A3M7RLW0_BRAPC|nr:hypothetical protein BpHYR1_030136 [Brachionus plicatilis]